MNASSRKSRFGRAYHEIHGSHVEDDIEIIVDASGFARSEAARSAERPRRTLREWWMASTPMERILRLWWWCVCAVGGAVVGLAGGVMIGALVLLA